MAFQILVTGPYACFKRPEFSHDLITYDIPTPMAVRRLFERIHWTPAIRWRVDSIALLRVPEMGWMTLPEAEALGGAATVATRIHAGRRDDRRVCYLADVAYVLTAHFDLTDKAVPADSAAHHVATFKQRLRQGRYFRTPYLGIRSFAATITEASPHVADRTDAALAGRRDFGWVLHDVHGEGGEGPRFFRAIARDGVIDLSTDESLLLAG